MKKIFKKIILVLILIAIALPLVFFSEVSDTKADTSIVSPSSSAVSSDSGLSCTDTAAWSNVTYVVSQNDQPAYISDNNLDANNVSQKLTISNFGLNLPAGSVVDGIVVSIDKYKTAGGVVDHTLRLSKVAGTPIGDNKAKTSTAWAASDTDTYTNYGGATDLWGTTWTEAEIESDGFGLVFCVKATSANSRPAIDHIQFTVYYTPPISVDLSGTVYGSEGGANIGAGKTVTVYKNGATSLGSDTTDSSGAWALTGLNISSGDIINAYIDGDPIYKGNTVFISDGNDQTDIHIYGGVLAMRHDTGTNVTTANLGTGIVGNDINDMMYSVSGSNLTATSSAEVHVWTGDTFAPNGTVKTQGNNGHLHIDDSASATLSTTDNTIVGNITIDSGASLTMSADTKLGGNFINNGAFTHNNSTLEFIDSSKVSAISSASDITFSTLKSTAAGKTVMFQKQTAGVPKFTVSGQFNFQGVLGNPILVTSDTAGSQWHIFFNSSQSSLNYIRLTDSGCAVGSAGTVPKVTILNGGNNGICWDFIERDAPPPVGENTVGGGTSRVGGIIKGNTPTGVTAEGGGVLETGGDVAPPSTIVE